MLKAITEASDVVNIATFENLNINMWKRQCVKEIYKDIQEEQELKKGIFELMPYFDVTIIEYEVKWRKRRQQFTRQQKNIVNKAFAKRYKDKIEEVLGGALSESFFESVM